MMKREKMLYHAIVSRTWMGPFGFWLGVILAVIIVLGNLRKRLSRKPAP
jgi:hypothetical protein